MIAVDNNKDFGEIEVQVLKHAGVLVSDLKAAIDVMNESWETVKDHIQEIARQVDEKRLCKQDEISRLIKRLLKDKIAEGKITEKWIEDCLSKEYKRKYTKSEVTSLSKKKNSETTNPVEQRDGTVLLQKAHNNGSDGDKEERSEEDAPKLDIQSQDSTENSVKLRLVELPKEMKGALLKALDECEQKCFLTFDDAGTLLSIETDVNRKFGSDDNNSEMGGR